jgi:hypothetical protein
MTAVQAEFQAVTVGTPLLRYEIATDPAPLECSRPGTVTVLVTNPGHERVYVRDLTVVLPVGSAALCLTAAGQGVDTTADDQAWALAALVEGQYLAAPAGEHGTLLPLGSGEGGTKALGLRFSLAQVNGQPGRARLTVREVAATTPGAWPAHAAYTAVAVVKRPVRVTPTRSGISPILEFYRVKPTVTADNKIVESEPVHLAWRTDGTPDVVLTYGPGVTPAKEFLNQSKKATNWKGTITRDTVFHLTATLANGRSHTASTTILKSTADVTATDLTTTGTIRLLSAEQPVRIPLKAADSATEGRFDATGSGRAGSWSFPQDFGCDGWVTVRALRKPSAWKGPAHVGVLLTPGRALVTREVVFTPSSGPGDLKATTVLDLPVSGTHGWSVVVTCEDARLDQVEAYFRPMRKAVRP